LSYWQDTALRPCTLIIAAKQAYSLLASPAELRQSLRFAGDAPRRSLTQLSPEDREMATSFRINGRAVSSDAPPVTPLLWVIREQLK
jgi:hypothetical protein